jgi:hypothetical protein
VRALECACCACACCADGVPACGESVVALLSRGVVPGLESDRGTGDVAGLGDLVTEEVTCARSARCLEGGGGGIWGAVCYAGRWAHGGVLPNAHPVASW